MKGRNMDPRTITKTTVDSQAKFEEAYNRIEAEMLALSPDEIAPINLEIASAVATVLYLWPGIQNLRETIVHETAGFDIARFDKLEDYAMALGHANTLHLIASRPPDDAAAIYEEGVAVRETLRTDTEALVHRGFIKAATIQELKGSIGFKNVAIDLQILASVLQANWAAIEGKCGIQKSELDHALKLSTVLFGIVGLRDNASDTSADKLDMRGRAYTLFTRAYDDVRRVVSYLRWQEGDADSFAPALHPGRSLSKKKSGNGESEPQATATDAGKTAGSAAPSATNPGAPATDDDMGPFMR